jgi:septum formation protein
MLEFDGQTWGKAGSVTEVVQRWQQLRGGRGLLHTGHFLTDAATGAEAAQVDTATVHFGSPSDEEIDAYARTAESHQVAGPFTLEGRSAPWIEGIEGNYGTIMGLSMAVLRRLLAGMGVRIIDLWR